MTVYILRRRIHQQDLRYTSTGTGPSCSQSLLSSKEPCDGRQKTATTRHRTKASHRTTKPSSTCSVRCAAFTSIRLKEHITRRACSHFDRKLQCYPARVRRR